MDFYFCLKELSGGGSIFRRREKFIRFIQESNFLKSDGMRWMEIYAIVFIVVASFLSVMTFFLVSSQMDEADQRYNYLSYSNQLTADG